MIHHQHMVIDHIGHSLARKHVNRIGLGILPIGAPGKNIAAHPLEVRRMMLEMVRNPLVLAMSPLTMPASTPKLPLP